MVDRQKLIEKAEAHLLDNGFFVGCSLNHKTVSEEMVNFALELVKTLNLHDVVKVEQSETTVCPDPSHCAMELGLINKCTTCGATQ